MRLLIISFIGMLLAWRFLSGHFTFPCPSWLGWMIERENPLARAHRSSFIITQLQVKPGMRVLDAGCGPGRLTLPLAQVVGPSGEVLAVDLQQGMLSRAKVRASQKGLTNIAFLQLALGKGGVPRDHFDRAVCISVLGEIPGQKAALQEIYKALKKGGLLAISETVFDPHYQSRTKMLELAKDIGFKKRDLHGGRLCYTLILEKP